MKLCTRLVMHLRDRLQKTAFEYAVRCRFKAAARWPSYVTRDKKVIAQRYAVNDWIKQTPTNFFKDGIFKLVPRWQRCIAGEGDYVEK